MAVIPRDQASRVLEILVTSGYPVTFTESRGGALRQAQHTLYTCVDEEAIDGVRRIIRENCRAQVEVETEDDDGRPLAPEPIPVTANLGGAVIFIWDVNCVETH